jgi:hypothetical protein
MTINISAFSGAASTISTAEHSMTQNSSTGVGSSTSAGIFQPFLDLNALTSGDDFIFRAYETVSTSGGTQREMYNAHFANAQASPVWAGPSLILGVGWDMTLTKATTGAVNRVIPFRIASVG